MSELINIVFVLSILFSLITFSTSACVDNSTNCADWSSNGFCQNTFYSCEEIQSYCAKSCNVGSCNPQVGCPGTVGCVDLSPSCPDWVSRGLCSMTSYTLAQQCSYCPQSCGLCDVCSTATLPPTPPPTPPPTLPQTLPQVPLPTTAQSIVIAPSCLTTPTACADVNACSNAQCSQTNTVCECESDAITVCCGAGAGPMPPTCVVPIACASPTACTGIPCGTGQCACEGDGTSNTILCCDMS